jgi:hypothetical protein
MNAPQVVWEGRIAESFLPKILEGVRGRIGGKGQLLWVEGPGNSEPVWSGTLAVASLQEIMDSIRAKMNSQGRLLWHDTD